MQIQQQTQNQNHSLLNSEVITLTDATKTQSLSFNSKTNLRKNECIEDIIKSLSSEIPYLNFLNEHSRIFMIVPFSSYLISQNDSMKIKTCKEEKLGGGGFGQVYLSTNLETFELHAIKVITNSFNNMIDTLSECLTQYHLASCNKELILNIVNMIQIRIVDSQAHFQIPLELAEFSLYDYIQNNDVNEEIYKQLINTLIDFLILLHQNNYAHRDIKPQNILYVKDVGWKLADFGECIYYESSYGLYKIKGTLAFLPQDITKEIRKQSKQNSEILQDLFKNDVYATVCTLVMIKNPKFKSLDLIQFMEKNQLDNICYQLLNISNYEDLKKLKVQNLQKFQYNGDTIQRKNELVLYDIGIIIKYFKANKIVLNEKIIQIIDNQLGILYQNNRIQQYNQITFQLVQFFPFQIQLFKNIKYTFDLEKVLKTPNDFLQNREIEYELYFERGLHQYLFDYYDKLRQKDTFQTIYTRLCIAIIYENIEEAKAQLNYLANKYYSETSQVNSDFIMFYNKVYEKLYSKYPIFYNQNQQIIDDNQQMRQLQDFSTTNLNEEQLQNYLNIQSFQVGGLFYLKALFHPLQREFIRFRSSKIFEHILTHLGCNVEQILEDRFTLSKQLKERLQILSEKSACSLQQILYGCVVLYLNYDLIIELLDLLSYFQGIQNILMYQNERFETTIEIQRISIKYNIDIDSKLQNLHNLKIVFEYKFSPYKAIISLLRQNIYHLQLKIIKENFKRDSSKFRLVITVGLLKSLKLIQKYQKEKKFLLILQDHLWKCIFKSQFKYQKRFLQAIIWIYQQYKSNQLFIHHLNNLRQYKRVINYSNREEITPKTLLNNNSLTRLLKSYPELMVQLLAEFYNKQIWSCSYKQHLINSLNFPRLRKKFPLHNINLKQMYLSRN